MKKLFYVGFLCVVSIISCSKNEAPGTKAKVVSAGNQSESIGAEQNDQNEALGNVLDKKKTCRAICFFSYCEAVCTGSGKFSGGAAICSCFFGFASCGCGAVSGGLMSPGKDLDGDGLPDPQGPLGPWVAFDGDNVSNLIYFKEIIQDLNTPSSDLLEKKLISLIQQTKNPSGEMRALHANRVIEQMEKLPQNEKDYIYPLLSEKANAAGRCFIP